MPRGETYHRTALRRLVSPATLFPYLLVVPTLAAIAVVILYPLLRAVAMSFYSVAISSVAQDDKWVGLANYARLISDSGFWHSLLLTLVYTVAVVTGSYLIGLFTAVLLDKPFRGRSVIRLLVILPWAVPFVVVAIVFMWMYDYQYGVFNYLLLKAHLIRDNIAWLVDPRYSLTAVILASIWSTFPIATVMFMAGLTTIPEELYEAASMDGATSSQLFRYITLPGLRSISLIIIMLFTVWEFKKFDIIWVMTQGGPIRATETLVVNTYTSGFLNWEIGYASATGVVCLVISLLFTLVYLRLMKELGGAAK